MYPGPEDESPALFWVAVALSVVVMLTLALWATE